MNITILLGPSLNIHRDPLCGRNFEYFSEDPVISGTMASAITLGVQEEPGVGVTSGVGVTLTIITLESIVGSNPHP